MYAGKIPSSWKHWLGGVVCLLAVNWSHAQNANPETVDEINRILNLEQQRQEQERRELEDRQRTHTVIPSKKPLEYDLTQSDGQACFDMADMRVEGISLIGQKDVDEVVQPYLGQCLGIAGINALISEITNLYIDSGYITSRAYIPPQNLQSGTLTIKVVEGFVEAIRVNGGPSRLAATAFPGAVGAPLNLRTIEQGLDQVNRISSAQARVEFVPGEKVGGTVVVIDYAKHALVQVSAGRNNSGQSSTGEQQMTAALEFQSPLGISDHLYLNAQADTRDDYQGQKSESAGAQYSVPLGYWTFSFAYNQFEYMNRVEGANTTFISRGDSQTERFTLKRMLFRDQNKKVTATGLVKHQASDNYIEDVKLQNSSVDYTAAELGVDYQHYLSASRTLTASVTYGRKLGGKGSNAQREIYQDDFQKLNIHTSYSDSTRWLAGTWRWSSSIDGQYAKGDLFSAETFSIGSQYTVRGYKEQGLSDSSGAYWRNDLTATYFPIEFNPRFYLAPYLALDTGFVEDGDSLTGWAGGLRLGGQYFRGDLMYGRPLAAPEPLTTDNSVVHFSFSLFTAW